MLDLVTRVLKLVTQAAAVTRIVQQSTHCTERNATSVGMGGERGKKRGTQCVRKSKYSCFAFSARAQIPSSCI